MGLKKVLSAPFIQCFIFPALLFITGLQSCIVKAQNTGVYRFSTDTTASLLLDRNGNSTDCSTESFLLSSAALPQNSQALTLPFPVLFMGKTCTHFMVNSGGAVVLAPNASVSFSAAMANEIQSVNSQYILLAPFWDALYIPEGSGVKYKVSGLAPFRTLVVEWYASTSAGAVAPIHDMQFQMRLYEGSNTIEYVYGRMRRGAAGQFSALSASIGFSYNGAASDSTFISLIQADSFKVSSRLSDISAAQQLFNVADSGVIKSLHSETEGRRRRLLFTPDSIAAPGNLSAFNITQNEALLYWDDNSTNESGFRVYRIRGTEYAEDTLQAANINFRSKQKLLPGTTYRFRVQVFNSYTSSYSQVVTFNTSAANLLTAKKNGNWNDTATWGGVIPTGNDSVVIPAGITVKQNASEAFAHQLLLNGNLEYEDNTLVRKLSINYDLQNNGRLTAAIQPSFNGILHELNIGQDLRNDRFMDLYNKSGIYESAVLLRFYGENHSNFSGMADTNSVYTLLVDKDDVNDSVVVNPLNLWVKDANSDLLSAKALLSSNPATGILRLTGSFILENRLFASTLIGSAKGFVLWIDNPGININPLGSDITMNNACMLRLSKGAINFPASLLLNAGSTLWVDGGWMSLKGQLKNSSSTLAASFLLSGGKVFCAGVQLNATSNKIRMLGGELVSNGSSNIQADPLQSLFTNARVKIGWDDGLLFKQFSLSGYYPHVLIDTTVNNAKVLKVSLNGSTTIHGNLWLQAGDTLDLSGQQLRFIGDTLNATGELKGMMTGSHLQFAGITQQYLGGTGPVQVQIFELDKSDTVNYLRIGLQFPLSAANVLMSGGKLIRSSSLQIGNGSALTVLKYGRSRSNQVGAYFDTVPLFNINNNNYHVYYLTEKSSRSTGYEIPQGRKVSGMFFSNKAGVSIAGGNIEVQDSLRLDSGIVQSSIGNEIILTDTLNHLSLVGGNSTSYFKGPFSRRIPAFSQAGRSYVFPVGDLQYKAIVIADPVCGNSSTDLRVQMKNASTSASKEKLLSTVDTSFHWSMQLTRGTASLSSFKIQAAASGINALSKLAMLVRNDAAVNPSDTFRVVGERVAAYIDSMEATGITNLNAANSFAFVVEGKASPDTLLSGTYQVGNGRDYQNLTAVSEALNSSYIDGPLVFEINKDYDTDTEKFPIFFEQNVYTQKPGSKKVLIRLARGTYGVVSTNNNKALPSGLALINFSGVDSLSFDGRAYDSTGAPGGDIEWTIRTGVNSGANPVIQFQNASVYNRLDSLRIIGNNASGSSGTLVFAGLPKSGLSGNNDNVINACIIYSELSSGLSSNHIYSRGHSARLRNERNTISGNFIYDYSGNGISIGSTANGPSWKISGNHIYQTQAASASINIPINFTPGSGSYGNLINANVIGGAAPNAAGVAWNYSGASNFIALQVGVDTLTATLVSNNIIRNFNVSGNGTSTSFTAIQLQSGTITVSGNLIGGANTLSQISIAGRGSSTMINSVSNIGELNISDNLLQNVNQTVSGSSITRLRGISHSGSAAVKINNNIITAFNSNSAGTDYRDAGLVGIYIISSSQKVLISRNRIYNLNMLATGSVTAISINSNAQGEVHNNVLYNINNASTSTGRYLMGINLENGVWRVYNNRVSLTNSGNESRSIIIAGIRLASTVAQQSDIVFNTVQIGGSTTATSATVAASYCYSQTSATYANLKNNIFSNERSSAAIHWALVVSGGNWINSNSDFNAYYSNTAAALFSINGTSGITAATFLSTVSSDRNSIMGVRPSFISGPADLRMADSSINCVFKGTAVPVSFVTEDFEYENRHNKQPDIGADEFTFNTGLPVSPVLFSGNDTLCSGLPRFLLASNPAAGSDIEWSASLNGGSIIRTGRDFNTGPISVDSTFYIQNRTGQCKSYRIAVPVKVIPRSEVTVLNAPQYRLCAGNSVLLQASSTLQKQINWYKDSTGNQSIASGNILNSGILNKDTLFYVQASDSLCPGQRKRININVDTTVLYPPATDTLLTACAGSTVLLQAGGINNAVSWYRQQGSALALSNDSILSVQLQNRDTSFYVASRSSTCESRRILAEIRSLSVPVLPVIDSVISICNGETLVINGHTNNGTLLWFKDSTAGSHFYTGDTLQLTSLSSDTVFYYSASNGVCAATILKKVAVSVLSPATPQPLLPDAICNNGSVSLSISNPDGIVEWFRQLADTQVLFNGNLFNANGIANDSIFYVSNRVGQCRSIRMAVPVDVIELPQVPQVLPSAKVCKGASIQLNVSSSGQVKWFDSFNSSQALSQDTFLYINSLNTDSVFYVSATYGACESPRIPVNAGLRVSPQPPVPDQVPDPICAGQRVQLSANAYDTIKWYASMNAITPLASSHVFLTPVLNGNSTYYLENSDGVCNSTRIAIPLSVAALPSSPVPAETNYRTCFNEMVTLKASGSAYIRWMASADPEDQRVLLVDSVFNSGKLTRDSSFYVENFNGTCSSSRIEIPVGVLNYLQGVKINPPATIKVAELFNINADGPASSTYLWDFGAGASVSGASGKGPVQLKYNSPGYKRITLSVNRKSGLLNCDTVLVAYLQVNDTINVSNRMPVSREALFNAYPNPARDYLYVEYGQQEEAALEFFDVTGRLLWSDKIKGGSRYVLPLSTWGKGLYILKLSNSSGVQTNKVIAE